MYTYSPNCLGCRLLAGIDALQRGNGKETAVGFGCDPPLATFKAPVSLFGGGWVTLWRIDLYEAKIPRFFKFNNVGITDF